MTEAHVAFGHRATNSFFREQEIVNHSELKMNGDISVGSVWLIYNSPNIGTHRD